MLWLVVVRSASSGSGVLKGLSSILWLVLPSINLFSIEFSCSCKAYSRFQSTSPMAGLSIPCSAKHFSAVSPNFLRDSGLMYPTSFGSMICSNMPIFCHCIAHSAMFTCSLGRAGLMAGLAHTTSMSTTPNEYTSLFSVSCCLRKYSGSR
ncbi:hypothetical protein Mapa_000308 [Marchantia paleacea]|nr:hypothetical protein Mapa_000308 [Marchantia paleacea]